jgi:hypothetical protein
MTHSTSGRTQAAVVAIAPLFLLAALAYHPFIANLTDKLSVAGAATADTSRWALAHIAVGLGAGLLLAALLAMCKFLQDAGEHRRSAAAVPFLAVGTTLFAFLPAMETAMGAASVAGADAVAVQSEIDVWFVPILIASSLTFAVGLMNLAVGVVESRVFDRRLGGLVAGALVVVAVTRFVPLGASLYLGGVAGVVALLPVAARMWSTAPARGSARRSALTPTGAAR